MVRTKIIEGRHIAEKVMRKVRRKIIAEKIQPHLATIFVGDDPASQAYLRIKKNACERVGIKYSEFRFSETTSERDVIKKIQNLNQDRRISGILVQLPLPKRLSEERIIRNISPKKDVDGLHPINSGLLAQGVIDEDQTVIPATPKGILYLLETEKIGVSGKHVVIVNRSKIVGRPLSMLMLAKDATVTICHSKTKNLAKHTKMADIIVVAVGSPNFLTKKMVNERAVVIDVGINRLKDGSLCGDADFKNLLGKVSAITPAPGGVGPLTVAMLLENTLMVAEKQEF